MPICPECNVELPEGAKEGLCPKCLMVQGLKIVSALASPGPGPPRSDLPRNFGDYELLEEIARGGMGIVYRARQRSLDRIVAVKTLLLSAHASPEFVKRFRAEASAAASLRHPNIVAIHEVGMHQDEHYLVMDYVAGPSLAKFINGKPLPVRHAAGHLKTIAEAIHYAHERGILHRDLKPSNVLIGPNDEPLVTDFGLSKRFGSDSQLSTQDSQLTVSGQVVGSPSYMPPEQAAGTRGKVGRRSDVYSLGAMLYHLLTERPPFVGETLNEILDQVFNREPISPRLLNPAVPRDLETICLKCLEKEADKRYATAQEFADELGRFLRGEPIHARPVSAPEKLWRWCRRKPALAGALATALLLLLVVAIGAPIATLRISRDRHQAERNLYVSEVRLASQALEDSNLPDARERLDRIAASPYQRKMRGWEWRYLMDQCRSDELMTLGRHDSVISGLALSSHDKHAASISEDGVVKLWDFAARKEVDAWPAHIEPVKSNPGEPGHALAFSPDGQTLATGGRDRSIRLWSVSSRQKLAELEKLEGDCTGLAYSRDGRVLAAVSITGEISLWSLLNSPPTRLNRWETKAPHTFALAFSSDAKHLMITGYGQSVRLWDVSEPQTPRELPAFDDTAFPAAISHDGKWLVAAASGAHALRRWELPARQERPRWPERRVSFISLAFSPDDLVLASGLSDGEIVLWDMAGERDPITLMGHEEYVSGLAFSQDGRMLLSASWDKTVRLWDISQGERAVRVVSHGFSAAGVCFSPDSRYLASVARERTRTDDGSLREQQTLKLWEVSGMKEVTNAPTGGDWLKSYPAFSPDGKFLAVGSWKSLQIYAVPSLRMVTNLGGFHPAFSADGLSMIYASGRRILRRDSPAAADAVQTVIGELSANIISLALSPDGNIVVCAGEEDGGFGVQFWDARGRRRLDTVTKHEGGVVKLAFSPDGQRCASASWDGKVGIWDVTRRRLIKLLRGDSGELNGVAFSPDGRTLVACGTDATIRLWNSSTLQEIALLRVHTTVQGVAFSPDGQWLAAAADGGTVHVWRAPSWTEIEADKKLRVTAP